MNTKALRQRLLDIAIQGRLVDQDPNDEPASLLLKRIRAEKERLVKEGKLKKANLNDSIIYKADDNKYYEKNGKTTKCIDDQIPFEIPESWEWCRLKSIGEIITGSTPPKDQSKYYGGDIPFFKPTDLEQGKDVRESNDHLTELGFDKSRKLPPNSVLVTCIGTIGKTGKISVYGSCNQQINAIIPNSAVLSDFLYYMCNSSYMQNKIKSEASATTLPILNKTDFSTLLLPLPPLSEQCRIVGKLEELLSVVERYEKAQDELDSLCNSLNGRLRKSILQEAIQGHLVPQDPNDEPASLLLKRIRAEKEKLVKEGKLKKANLNDSIIYKAQDNKYYEKTGKETECIDDQIPFEIPSSWEWCRLGNIVSTSIGKTPERGHQTYWSNGIYNWVAIADMIDGGVIKSTKEKVSQIAADKCFGPITPAGSLIMSFKLTIGRTSILGLDAYHNEAIVTLKPYLDTNNFLRNYLFHIMPKIANTGDAKEAIKGKTLNSKSIFNLLLPLPPLSEQRRIVGKLEELFGVLDRLSGK